MIVLRFAVGLVLAAGIHILSLRIDPGITTVVDSFLILTVYHSLRHGPGWSAVGGTITGLTADALTGGLYGLFGFANTLVAYLSARVQQRFVVQQPMQVALLCALAAALQVATLALLQFGMVADGELPGHVEVLSKMATTGLVGMLLWIGAGRVRTWDAARRFERSRRLRFDR